MAKKKAKDRHGIKVYDGMPYSTRIAKVLADPLRVRIVSELGMREMSPKQFQKKFGGGSLSRVSRAFEVLVEYGWLRQIRTKTGGKRRGAVEHFYRATQPAVLDKVAWPEMPGPVKDMFTGMVFETFSERVIEAVEARTIDAREDRHFTWSPLGLDEEGWKRVLARIDALFFWLAKEQEAANARMAKSGEEPIPMTVGLAAFESPKDVEKQP